MSENPAYYNTTNLSGKDLGDAVASAFNQEEIIYGLYKRHSKLSPSQVGALLNHKYPLTSVRRAITNLTKKNYLVKTDEQRKGFYGKPEYVWEIII